MPSRKVKLEKESKEERVAKIGFKQTVLLAVITALLTTATAICVALINKPATLNTAAEVQYFEVKAKISLADFREKRKELEKAKEEAEDRLIKEKDSEKIQTLKEVRTTIATAIETNEKAQERFEENAGRSLEETKQGNGVAAAIFRKKANDSVQREVEVRQRASSVVERERFINQISRDMASGMQERCYKDLEVPHYWERRGRVDGTSSHDERERHIDREPRDKEPRALEYKRDARKDN